MDLSLYRPNVGIVLFNRERRVWMGRRVGGAAPYTWQFPQGGIDEGESYLDAALRELHEETGVTSVRELGHTADWIAYDYPEDYAKSKDSKGWRGQKQVWYALEFIGEESEIRLDQHHQIEFDAWRWERLEAAPGLIVPFKQASYEAVVGAFRHLAP